MDDTERRMVPRWQQFSGKVTVDDVLAWCHQHNLDPAAVTVVSGQLKYETPQTDEEKERADAYKAATDSRHETWERAKYIELRAKYGDTDG